MSIPRIRSNLGFTLIEVAVTILIVGIAAVGMLQGIAYAKHMLRSTKIEKRALEELQGYVEQYRAVLSTEGMGVSYYVQQPREPKEVLLWGDEDEENGQIIGYIDRETVTQRTSDGVPGTERFYLKAWIEWDEYPNDGMNILRRMEADISVFPLL